MSAAFRSNSSQHSAFSAPNGPDVGHYDAYASNTIAAQAAKTTGRTPRGAFGASARELDWGKKGGASERADQESAMTANVPSSFAAPKSSARSKGPSAAMGGTSRFAVKQANEGDYYTPPALGASKSYNGNRRTSMLGTMGSSKRFNEVKVVAQGDYSDARPGAFASASKKSTGAKNTGFGGTTARETAFGAAAKRAEDNASSHLSYDTSKITGAFAKAIAPGNKSSSAAFASKSSQRTAQPVTDGPGAQSYSTANVNSMAGNVNKSFNKSLQSGTGGFGTSARRTSEGISARGADVPGPGEYAPDISDATPRAARPSSAFASRTNKGDYVRKTDAAGVGDYDAHTSDGMAATATKTFNRKSLGSMGSSKRFMPAKEAVQGDYSGARPGAFEKSMTKSGRSNTGFGGTTRRETAFDAAAKRAEDNASSHLSYDTSKITGAFAKAGEASNKSSAAFASKSSQRTAQPVTDGPGAQSYSTADVNSMAGNVNKSFNKSAQSGTGGFGTSARRTSEIGIAARGADVPGPGEYAPDISDAAPQSARPSSAFASRTNKGDYVQKSDTMGVGDYDAHTSDGMAATATKTFNRKSLGSMGTTKRVYHQTRADMPGPGEYQQNDPTRPTVESNLVGGKGKGTGAFASTTLRDTSQWNNQNSNFLP